jgi:lysozyme
MIDQVLDLSRYNTVLSFPALYNAGIRGIIHKATQNDDHVDPCYVKRVQPIRSAGIMHGAYHFGTGDTSGYDQAVHFLETVNPDDRTLLALDWEDNPSGSTMRLDQATRFVWTIHEETGRWPLIYSGHLAKEILGATYDATLAKCPLWLAQYGQIATTPATWPRWALWQYTDKGQVDGIKGNVDRSRFNGDLNALRHLWGYPPLSGAPTKPPH